MSLLDKILRLFGTNRVQLSWRWRRMREGRAGAGRRPERSAPQTPLIPDDFPLVTVVLLGLCGIFYFLAVKLTSDLTAETTSQPGPAALVRYGATFPPAIQLGEWWRTISAVFLHANLPHILMNSLGLWTLGTLAEDRFGRARMLVVFIVTGVMGMVTSVMWHDMVLGVGASGAIFGLMGCILAHAFRQGGQAGARELRERLIPWVLYGLVLGFAIRGVDNAAHLGGLVTGGVFGLFLGERAIARRVRWVWEVAAVMAIVAVAFAFYAASMSPLVRE
jgi:rhomboid protease GluP